MPKRPAADAATRMIVDRFNQAFNRHDPDALAAWLTDDTLFEDTSPPPDGQRIEGKATVVAFWREWFARNPDARFEAEEIIVSGDSRRGSLGISQDPQGTALASTRRGHLHGARR